MTIARLEYGIPRLLQPLPRTCIRPRRKRYYARGVRQRVYERDGHRCIICHRGDGGVRQPDGIVLYPPGTTWLTLHHVHAHTLGGCSHDHNLVTLCGDCNTQIGVAA